MKQKHLFFTLSFKLRRDKRVEVAMLTMFQSHQNKCFQVVKQITLIPVFHKFFHKLIFHLCLRQDEISKSWHFLKDGNFKF